MVHAIGVDVSVTTLKLGLFDEDGNLIRGRDVPTPWLPTPGTITIALCEAVRSLDPDYCASLIGISLPGSIDVNARVARVCINLPGWRDVPLAEWLEARLNRRVILADDISCDLEGEVWKGAAVNFADVVLLTVGARVSAGVMLGGKMLASYSADAAKLGLAGTHFNIASGQFVRIDTAFEHSHSHGSIELAQRDDQQAFIVWGNSITTLGLGISSLIYTFTPQVILLGGVLASGSSYFLTAVRQQVEQLMQVANCENPLIRSCALGNSVRGLGAAHLALRHLGRGVNRVGREDDV